METLEDLGAYAVQLAKQAGYAPPETSYSLHGKLYASASGWVLLHVPNALGRGAFEALHEVGAEMPEGPGGTPYNAHISVIRPEELEALGLTPDDIVERGRDFSYTLGPVQCVNPRGWDEMKKVWFIKVRSPELQALRKSYGMTPKPHNNEHEFHITFAVARKEGVKVAAPTASLIHEPEKYMAQAALRPARLRRPMTQTSGGRFASTGSTKRVEMPTGMKEAAGSSVPDAVRKILPTLKHCGDYGRVYWNPKLKQLFACLGDADDGETADVWEAALSKIKGVESVKIEFESSPDWDEADSDWWKIRRPDEKIYYSPEKVAGIGSVLTPEILRRWALPAAAAAGIGLGVHFFPEPEGQDHLIPVDDEADAIDPAQGRLNNVLRWPKRFKWAAEADEKTSALLPSVKLQPHQAALEEESEKGPMRKMLVHSLGSGKTLSSLAVGEAAGDPATVVVPAALRNNYRKEQAKFTDMTTPTNVLSYTQLARGGAEGNENPTVTFDEAHRLREPGSQQTQQAMALAAQAKRLLLLTGTPIVNRPSDLAVPMEMLTQRPMTPEMFTDRYVTTESVDPGWIARLRGIEPGERLTINNRADLEEKLRGKIDYYAPPDSGVEVTNETHKVQMSPEQHTLHNAFWGELPFWARWKMERDFPLSQKEQRALAHFWSGPRQVGLSTLPFMRGKADPQKAFQQSPKLQKAMEFLQEGLKDPNHKAIVYSNFIRAGLEPYAAELKARGISHGIFSGGVTDAQRKQVVDDYNANKLRVLLLGPAGAEGISTKGTREIQVLDPHWNETRIDQAIGRGLRYDSHTDLPEDQRRLLIRRFESELPPTTVSRLMSLFGGKPKSRPATDAALNTMSTEKENLNEEFYDLLRQIGTRPKAAASPTVQRLRQAKAFSDAGRYDEKHNIIRGMMEAAPTEWVVDDPTGRHVGVTHSPTGFRLHMDRTQIPSGINV